MYKVLVTDKINKVAGDILADVALVDYKETMSEDDLAKIIGEYDALMVRSQTKVTPKIIEAANKMKIVGRAGVGVDNVNLESATQKGIIVVNSPDGNTTAAAEHTVAMMLAMTRHIPNANISTKAGKWERSKFTGTEVFNKFLGIIGLGKIGSRVAKAALGLGMKVMVYDPFASKANVEKLGANYVEDLEEFWPKADFISVHVPKTKDTLNLINKDTFSKMKKGVRLVNCARGGIINEADLKDAVENGLVAAAAVDVFSSEPMEKDNPLLDCKGNLILTPHLGASTKEAQLNVAVDVAEQIRDVLKGESARSAVNIPSLKAEKLEPVKEYMTLAENLGILSSQLCKGAINQIKIKANGTLAKLDIDPLKVAILKGILSSSLESVNYVNAPILAESRGIEIVETKSEQSISYVGLITVKVISDKSNCVVAGAIGGDGTPRIVRIDNCATTFQPSEHTIFAPHHDKPGMIANVSNVLSEKAINVSMMQVARKEKQAGGESLMIINTDSPVENETLVNLSRIDGIYDAVYVSLIAEKQPDQQLVEI